MKPAHKKKTTSTRMTDVIETLRALSMTQRQLAQLTGNSFGYVRLVLGGFNTRHRLQKKIRQAVSRIGGPLGVIPRASHRAQ